MAEARRTLVDVVVDKVLEHIISGDIKADDALPPEADIAKESGVSRLTAREAMKVLKAQNVVYVKRGLGPFVCLRSAGWWRPGRPNSLPPAIARLISLPCRTAWSKWKRHIRPETSMP